MNTKKLWALLILIFNSTLLIFIFFAIKNNKQKSKNYIRVGVYADAPPFAYMREGKVVGIEIEIIKEIFKRLNKNYKLQCMPIQSIFSSLKYSTIDVGIGSLESTPKRSRRCLFSIPHFKGDSFVFLSKTSNFQMKSLENLKNKTIIITENNTIISKIHTLLKKAGLRYDETISDENDINLLRILNQKLGFVALSNNYGDAFILVKSTADFLINKYGKNKIFSLYSIDEITANYHICVSKKNQKLIDQINKTLEDMKKDGTLKILHDHTKGFKQ
ncbi:transporter substrate-binding domain-containing protein [bacterium]|nr:transporter substrate-binding domain-containing protein [bacterium]